jgi:aconitase A
MSEWLGTKIPKLISQIKGKLSGWVSPKDVILKVANTYR